MYLTVNIELFLNQEEEYLSNTQRPHDMDIYSGGLQLSLNPTNQTDFGSMIFRHPTDGWEMLGANKLDIPIGILVIWQFSETAEVVPGAWIVGL